MPKMAASTYEVPQLRDAGEHHGRQDTDHDGPDRVADEHQRARREAVAERAADEHEDRARDAGDHEHGAERQPGAGELEREPGQRDEVELVAEDRDRLAAEQDAEVAQPQRAEERQPLARAPPAVGAGDAAVGSGRRQSSAHSSVIRTPSPDSSSASTIVPAVFDSTASVMRVA